MIGKLTGEGVEEEEVPKKHGVKECIVMPQNNACIVRLWLGGLLCPLHNTKVCCQLKICHHLASLDQHGS